MRPPNLLAAVLVSVLCTSPSAAGEGDPALRFETVAPGVTAVLQPRERWVADSNAVIVHGPGGALVVDAQSDAESVRRTIDRVEGLAGVPPRYLVNTHWHNDHTQGSHLYRQRFGPALAIVGHHSLRSDVPERAGAYVAEQRRHLAEVVPQAEAQLERGLSLGGVELDAESRERQRIALEEARRQLASYEGVEMLAPDLLYADRLTLWLGDLEVRLRHFRAHTDGDTVLYLPRQKVLVTGDLLDVLPYAGHGHLRSWIEALDELAELDVERIVPGHGPVFEGKDQLELVRGFLEAVVGGARSARARGQSVEEARSATDLSRFRRLLTGGDPVLERNFDAFAPEAVTRAYEELAGE